MQTLMLATIRATECSECGGLWLAPDVLQQLTDHHDVSAIVTSALSARTYTSATPDVVRYIPCPKCTTLMNRVNFAHSSGVIVDVCKNDGVWLDRGELQRVIGFIDRGGLANERKRQTETLAEERRRVQALRPVQAPAEITITTHRHFGHHSDDVGVGSLLAQIAAHLIS